jgi:hypothetical protein
MVYHSVADIFEMIEKIHVRFTASVTNLTEAQENFHPAPGRWSIAENAEHISIVNTGLLRLTKKLLKQAEADPKPVKFDLQLPPLTVTDEGKLLERKWEAPEIVVPQGGARVVDSLAANNQVINDLFALKPRLEMVDLSEMTWPHPILGQLNLYQWLLLLGEHEERHRLQIETVKSSSDFPSTI